MNYGFMSLYTFYPYHRVWLPVAICSQMHSCARLRFLFGSELSCITQFEALEQLHFDYLTISFPFFV